VGVWWASVFKSHHLALDHHSESPLLGMFVFVKRDVLVSVGLKFWISMEEELLLPEFVTVLCVSCSFLKQHVYVLQEKSIRCVGKDTAMRPKSMGQPRGMDS